MLNDSTATDDLNAAYSTALLDTLNRMQEITEDDPNIPISDGEITKPSFVTYPIAKLNSLKPDGVVIPFADGHTRQLPVITEGPFVYSGYAVDYLRKARTLVQPGKKLKQAVISASAMSLLYPPTGIADYSQEQFLEDVVKECTKDIRLCLDEGASVVQMVKNFIENRNKPYSTPFCN